jgi:MscS family membrane protein
MRSARSLFTTFVRVLATCALGSALYAVAAHAQKRPAASQPAASAQEAPWKDPLGRSTPRGTVTGFLNAARARDNIVAAQYLNAKGAQAETLAHELFVVLDARLPARLMRISDAPEGSAEGVLTPNQEVVGTIEGSSGTVDIVVERVSPADQGPIWLFSAKTLEAVPSLYDELVSERRTAILPAFLIDRRLGGIRLFDCLAVVLGLPLLYLATVLLNRALTSLLRVALRRNFRRTRPVTRSVLPAPARVLVVILAGGWLLAALPVSLAVRQLWSNLAGLIATAAVAWLLIRLNGEIERHIHRRFPPPHAAAAASLLRLVRRGGDALVLFGMLIVMLRQRGIDPTPALAGLGVGGIAVALAAQKTLENVIAGASLIFDQAVRVGDFLKMGDVIGTVDHIGLRSTRIRTLDRTVVSVPNGQIANVSLETISSRDKFWFHPVVGLRYETTSEQLHSVVDGIRRLLTEHPLVDLESVRVRFFRLGPFSLDIDVFAYLLARDWNHFLEIQEQILFDLTEIVSRAGASIAMPSQTMYFANTPSSMRDRDVLPAR